MKRIIIPLVLSLGLLPGWGQTNTNKPMGNYYSWQHPEWPPTPAPYQEGLRCYSLFQTNVAKNSFLVDDREVKYPPEMEDRPSPLIRYSIPAEELVRYPDFLARTRIQVAVSEQHAVETGNARDRNDALMERKELERLERIAAKVTPSPISLSDKIHMEQVIYVGEIARTNRQALLNGVKVNVPGKFSGYTRMNPEKAEWLAAIARAALAAQNTNMTALFKAAVFGQIKFEGCAK